LPLLKFQPSYVLNLTFHTLIRTAGTNPQITLCSTVPPCFKISTIRHKHAQSIEVHCAGPLFLMHSESYLPRGRHCCWSCIQSAMWI